MNDKLDLIDEPMTRYTFDQWAENEAGWDTDTGRPGIMYVANALQAWSTFNFGSITTVKRAAEVFNLREEDVRAAIEAHPWMFIAGEGDEATIEHDGE